MSPVIIKAIGVVVCSLTGCMAARPSARLLAERVQAYQRAMDPVGKAKARAELERLVNTCVFRAPRGYLGVILHRVNVLGSGRLVIKDRVMPAGSVWVARVVTGTPAERAGVQADDFIVAVDGQRWATGPDGFTEYVQSKHPRDKLELAVLRGAATKEMTAVLGELPASERARAYSAERRQAFFERWWREQVEHN